MDAWLGLGSNLQQPVLQLRSALEILGEMAGLEILKLSSFYRTPPWGDAQQDDFINAVVHIDTRFAPDTLLHKLQSIEDRLGRPRSARRWGPRVREIDLLLYGDLQLQSRELEIPHPRMHERAFVLMPLFELDPELGIPGKGTVRNCLKQVDCRGIIQLSDEDLV